MVDLPLLLLGHHFPAGLRHVQSLQPQKEDTRLELARRGACLDRPCQMAGQLLQRNGRVRHPAAFQKTTLRPSAPRPPPEDPRAQLDRHHNKIVVRVRQRGQDHCSAGPLEHAEKIIAKIRDCDFCGGGRDDDNEQDNEDRPAANVHPGHAGPRKHGLERRLIHQGPALPQPRPQESCSHRPQTLERQEPPRKHHHSALIPRRRQRQRTNQTDLPPRK